MTPDQHLDTALDLLDKMRDLLDAVAIEAPAPMSSPIFRDTIAARHLVDDVAQSIRISKLTRMMEHIK